METLVGVDIGGTKVAVGVGNAMGQVFSRSRRATAECGDGEALLESACRLIDGVLQESRLTTPVSRIGLALPGPVDRVHGCLVGALTLPGLNFRDLAGYFQDRYGVPVALDNDANAAGLGEAYFGAGRGSRVLVYFTISTGVGGSIVADGRLFRGVTGNAGEFGHQTIVPGGPRCDCGKHGCLEALVSGPAIARRGRALAARHPGGALAGLGETLTAETLAQAAAEDPVARRVWEETGYYLGIGIAHAIAAVGPDTVVLGGGVVGAGDLLLQPAIRSAQKHTQPHLFAPARIVPAALGENVGILGAIALAMEDAGVLPVDTRSQGG